MARYNQCIAKVTAETDARSKKYFGDFENLRTKRQREKARRRIAKAHTLSRKDTRELTRLMRMECGIYRKRLALTGEGGITP